MRNVITSFEKLKDEVKRGLIEKYPDGIEEELSSHQDIIKGGYFRGLFFEYEDVKYLIKVNQMSEVETFIEEEEMELPDEENE